MHRRHARGKRASLASLHTLDSRRRARILVAEATVTIRRITSWPLRAQLAPDEAFAYSQSWYEARTSMIVEVECDDGTVGWARLSAPL